MKKAYVFSARAMALFIALTICLTVLPAEMEMTWQEDMARCNLTEVYGYEGEDAKSFVFSDDGQGKLSYWHKDHPEWMYTLNYGKEINIWSGATPFYNGQYHRYPGEGIIRFILYRAKEQKWFSNWNKASMDAMYKLIYDESSISMQPAMIAGLTQHDITAAQAIDAFFVATHGEPYQWTKATRKWRDLVLKENGLTAEAPYTLAEGKPFRFERKDSMPVDITEFTKTIPQPLEKAMAHPKLEGWRLLSGALQEQTNAAGELRGTALAAFEKDGIRLLVMFMKTKDAEDYLALPVGENALYTDRDLKITSVSGSVQMKIAYEPVNDQQEMFTVIPVDYGDQNQSACVIDSYLNCNQETGESFQARGFLAGWELTQVLKNGDIMKEQIDAPVVGYMEAIDIKDFPSSFQAFKALKGSLIPEGYALLNGVNLRQKTSSRSHSLGVMNNGTLAQVLGEEPGDPNPWLHVKVGSKEGYVSTTYVSSPVSPYGTSVAHARNLPVGKTKKAVELKSGTGWLDKKVTDLEKDTKLHVLTEQNGWLYVVVPRGEIGWFMDVGGTYGYVWAGDVVISGSGLKLDWME